MAKEVRVLFLRSRDLHAHHSVNGNSLVTLPWVTTTYTRKTTQEEAKENLKDDISRFLSYIQSPVSEVLILDARLRKKFSLFGGFRWECSADHIYLVRPGRNFMQIAV